MLEMKQFYEEAQAIREQLVADRRYLHQIPELSMDLPKTTAYVCKRLDEIGVSYERLVGGVVATIGKPGGKVFLCRGDMDALHRKRTALCCHLRQCPHLRP